MARPRNTVPTYRFPNWPRRCLDISRTEIILPGVDQAFVLEQCRPPGNIIDLGAGTGLSPEMLKVLRAKSAALGLDIPCVCANLVELGMFADHSFDHAACLFSTLGLIVGTEARRRFLTHVYRMLRPGGIFVVHVHNRWFNVWTSHGRRLLLRELIASSLGKGERGDYEMPAHQGVGRLTMHLFTRGEIVGLLRSVGFDIAAVRPLSLHVDGRLRAPWWLGRVRSYGYLIAARKPLITTPLPANGR